MLVWEKEFSRGALPVSSLSTPPSSTFPGGYSPQTFFGNHIGWMRASWIESRDRVSDCDRSSPRANSQKDGQEDQCGSEILLKSIEHPACYNRWYAKLDFWKQSLTLPPASAASSIELGQHSRFKRALQTQATHVKLQAYSTHGDRLVSLAVLWVHSVSLVSHSRRYISLVLNLNQMFFAFGSETTQEEKRHLLVIHNQLSQHPDRRLACQTVMDLVALLRRCGVPLLAHMTEKHLASLQDIVFSAQVDDSELAGFLGKAWIGAAYMLLDLYFPEIPMDPLGGQHCQSLVWDSRLEWLHTHIHTLSLAQTHIQGASFESSLVRLRDRVTVAETQRAQFKPVIVRGPNHLQHLTEVFTSTLR